MTEKTATADAETESVAPVDAAPAADRDPTLDEVLSTEGSAMAAEAEAPPAPPPSPEPPEPEYPAESEEYATDDGAKVWLRQNIHWLLRELDLIKEGHSEADREKLNP